MRGGFPFERFVAWIDEHHRGILVAAAVLAALSALSLFRLRFDMDVLAQLPARAEAFRDYAGYLRRFGVYDSLYVVVQGEKSEILSFADRLAPELSALPEVESVRWRIDSAAVEREGIRPRRFELLTEEDYERLAGRLSPEAIRGRLAALRSALAMPMSIGARRWLVDDPFGIDEILGRSLERRYGNRLVRPTSDFLLAASGDALLLVVRPRASAFDTIFAERLLTGVAAAERALLDGAFAGHGIRVGHTGSYVYAQADKRVLQRDFRIYFVFAPLAVLAAFHWGLRTLRVLPFVTIPLALTTVVTFALSLLCFGSLNMISVAFAGIFYGLGIDSSIYFYALVREKAAERPGGLRAALGETLRELGAANVVASTTTAAAFLVIGFSDFTGVSQLGWMTAAAMVLNVPATLVLLPALVFAWGEGAMPPAAARGPWSDRYGRAAAWLSRRPRLVVGAVIAIVASSALGLPGLRLDTEFRHLRPSGGEGEEVERLLRERFGQVDADGVVIDGGRGLDEALRKAESAADALDRERARGRVTSSSSLAVFVPSRETAARRLERFRRLPRREAAESLRTAAADLGFAPGTFDAFLADWLAEPRLSDPAAVLDAPALAPLREQHVRRGADGTWIATYFEPAPGASLAAVAGDLRGAAPQAPPTVAGRALVEEEFRRLLRRELALFLGAALALNLLLVVAAERSAARAAAILAPSLAALVVYLGTMGALGWPIDPINVIVLPLLLGLGVDDTVYLLAHVRHAGSIREGSRRGALPLGLAVATTIVGFGSLGLSEFPALARLGVLAGYGLLLCVAAALVVSPVLGRQGAAASGRPATPGGTVDP